MPDIITLFHKSADFTLVTGLIANVELKVQKCLCLKAMSTSVFWFKTQ